MVCSRSVGCMVGPMDKRFPSHVEPILFGSMHATSESRTKLAVCSAAPLGPSLVKFLERLREFLESPPALPVLVPATEEAIVPVSSSGDGSPVPPSLETLLLLLSPGDLGALFAPAGEPFQTVLLDPRTPVDIIRSCLDSALARCPGVVRPAVLRAVLGWLVRRVREAPDHLARVAAIHDATSLFSMIARRGVSVPAGAEGDLTTQTANMATFVHALAFHLLEGDQARTPKAKGLATAAIPTMVRMFPASFDLMAGCVADCSCGKPTVLACVEEALQGRPRDDRLVLLETVASANPLWWALVASSWAHGSPNAPCTARTVACTQAALRHVPDCAVPWLNRVDCPLWTVSAVDPPAAFLFGKMLDMVPPLPGVCGGLRMFMPHVAHALECWWETKQAKKTVPPEVASCLLALAHALGAFRSGGGLYVSALLPSPSPVFRLVQAIALGPVQLPEFEPVMAAFEPLRKLAGGHAASTADVDGASTSLPTSDRICDGDAESTQALVDGSLSPQQQC